MKNRILGVCGLALGLGMLTYGFGSIVMDICDAASKKKAAKISKQQASIQMLNESFNQMQRALDTIGQERLHRQKVEQLNKIIKEEGLN